MGRNVRVLLQANGSALSGGQVDERNPDQRSSRRIVHRKWLPPTRVGESQPYYYLALKLLQSGS